MNCITVQTTTKSAHIRYYNATNGVLPKKVECTTSFYFMRYNCFFFSAPCLENIQTVFAGQKKVLLQYSKHRKIMAYTIWYI